MQYIDSLQNQQGGFNFDLSIRNELLAQKTQTQNQQVTFKKTGTTIVGLVYKDGVILAADTRATAGTVVADKNCEKIDFIAPNMYCCGAGTAADTQYVKYLMKSQMELMRLNTNRQSRVSTCVTRLQQLLFQHQGHIGAHLILGGYDIKGPQLCMLSNNGYISYLPYATMGSGSLAAVSILESKYKDNMELEEARQLCIEAIEAGIFHDLGSGSNVDLCIISKEKSEMQRNIKIGQSKMFKKQIPYDFPIKDTPFFSEKYVQINEAFEKMEIIS